MTINSSAPLVNDDQITWQTINSETHLRSTVIPTSTQATTNDIINDASKNNFTASSKSIINIHENNNEESEDMCAPKDMYVLYYEE